MILILGHQNDEKYLLSKICFERCELAIENIGQHNHIICSGSFGVHFNNTDKAHSELIINYLKSKLQNSNLNYHKLFSSNTYEDILAFRKFAIDHKLEKENTIIVTSEFHQKRIELLCNYLLFDFNITYLYSKTKVSDPELEIFKVSELKKINLTKDELLYSHCYDVYFPKEIYENANLEQKHYDLLSIGAISGLITSYGLIFNFLISLNEKYPLSIATLIVNVFSTLPLILLYLLYIRLAETALVARKTLRGIELAHLNYGFSTKYKKKFNIFKINNNSYKVGIILIMKFIIFFMIFSYIMIVLFYYFKKYFA